MITGEQLNRLVEAGATPEQLKVFAKILDESVTALRHMRHEKRHESVTRDVTQNVTSLERHALRQKRYRDRLKNKIKPLEQNKINGSNHIISSVTRDVTRDVTHENTPISSLLKEKNIKEKKERLLGARFELVTLPEEWRAYCEENRKDLKPESVFEDFRDYWIAKPGAAALKLDWSATWRTWVRKQSAPHANGRSMYGGPAKVESTEERYNRMKSKGLVS